MIAPYEHRIIISPIGDLEPSILERVSHDVSERFGLPTEVISLLQDMEFALDPARQQYNSTLILERLAGLAPRGALKLLAICNVDLFIPILTYVYGEAQLGGKTCIISTYRLSDKLPVIKTERIYHQRIIKEAIHELGHTFNLRHCRDPFCCMHYCRTTGDVDNKTEEFCRYCGILLQDEVKALKL